MPFKYPALWPLPLADFLIYDSAVRADSVTSPGVPTGKGPAWVPEVGTWGIKDNRLYTVTGTSGDFISIDPGEIPKRVSVDCVSSNWHDQSVALTVYLIDANNYMILSALSGGADRCIWYSKIAGVFSSRATCDLTPFVTDGVEANIAATLLGNDLIAYANGNFLMSYTMTPSERGLFLGNRKVALAYGDVSAPTSQMRFRNFKVS